ncbi:MAG: hypothetical protein ACXVB9_16710 [Bdellovibrionota bacterium]
MNRNSTLAVTLAVAALLSGKNSFALVSELAVCEAKDGRYEITIDDRQGTGLGRKADPIAEIRDEKNNEVVATYPVTTRRGNAIGFIGLHYIDTETNGQQFDLVGPSTNIRGYSLRAKLESGKSIKDGDVKCSAFGGAVSE